MLVRVVSGGQSGADQAGWLAARALGIPTGGWMPLGFLTEDGPRPEFADIYGAAEMPTAGYSARTLANARDSDGTVWFGAPSTPGAAATLGACRVLGKPVYIVEDGITRPSHVAGWIGAQEVEVLNVAGNRESKNPGIGERVEAFLMEVFRRLGHGAA